MYSNYRRQVFINFELPNAIRTWKDENDVEQEGVFTVGAFYTASLNEKANLRKMLESWRGQGFTEDELAGYSPVKLPGVPAMVNVIHNDKGKAQISAVTKPPSGTKVPSQVNESIYFSLDNFDQATFDKLGKGFQNIIKKSEEWKQRCPEGQPQQAAEPAKTSDFVDDDIPF
jgi:hypothetical protein